MHRALYPVNVPTSTAERTSSSCVSIVMNAPCSGAICIMLIPPSSAVLRISSCWIGSGGRAVRDEVLVDVGTEEERLGIGHTADPTVAPRSEPKRAAPDAPQVDGGFRRSDSAASTSSVPRAVAAHVNRSAWRRAPVGRAGRAARGRPRTRSSAATQLVGAVGEEPGHALGDGVGVTGDAGGDRRGAARGRLGHRHPPTLAGRGAGQHPRPPVEVDQRRRR